MKKLNKGFYATIAGIATVVATVISTSACWFFFYQPEEPKSLRDK